MTDEKKRGRPRAYDPELALRHARDVFWNAGFAGSSLDQLSEATAMNRPSLYAAFGDKEALYLKTLENYRVQSRAALAKALAADRPLKEGIAAVYAIAINFYLAGQQGARGCYLIGTASSQAVLRPAVRDLLRESLDDFDKVIEDRIRLGIERGEARADADPVALARLASAVMHSLAIRARAGEDRPTLEAMAKSGLEMICTAAGIESRRRLKAGATMERKESALDHDHFRCKRS